MKAKFVVALLIFGTICNLVAAQLPPPDLSKINRLGCNAKNFEEGGFTIENLQNPDAVTIKLNSGESHKLYNLTLTKKNQLSFAYLNFDMMLKFDKTSLEDDTNYHSYEVYEGMLLQVVQDLGGYTYVPVLCFNLD
ncbi:MAG: hypothetical protein A2381_01360 [Bdellovibrionales bacterium RIFOXYB1_FULL_37_110]|nr:MAG: hypothetical protein A2417_02215 [Bdellovibrionales bacterium RIFOXYC1_FULL_37_79]OFZ58865.1 MAG: hypothetical protein A2381_01360 [Bdellovibrionales bacterium RIFOXYB1_FULL_37_110]OFZ64689.1 MAG: hypothetical protein A2577_13575 [Bdellovibrionales bacterium RIFOXYD1_FULL_36_51]